MSSQGEDRQMELQRLRQSRSFEDIKAIRVACLQVKGMTCSSCTLAVEQALAGLDGVRSVAVSLMQAEAKVEYDAMLTSEEQMLGTIEDVGFESQPLRGPDRDAISLQVGGMTCSSCSTAIEHMLAEEAGILEFSVALLSGRAEVVYDAATIGPRRIKSLVEDLGYTAELVSADNLSSGMDERAREIRFWKRKFWIGFVFSLPVFLLAMVFEHTPGTKEGLNTNVGGFTVGVIVKWILTTPVLVYVGWSFHVGAFKALKRGRANMDVLISGGSMASYVYSLISVFHRFSQYRKGNHGTEAKDYFETAALLITFLSLGKLLEAIAKGKTSEAITKLLHLAPSSAILLHLDENGATISEEEVPAALIQKDDHLKVLPGARIPADGVVHSGRAFVDESMITGESRPAEKRSGSEVIAGSVNGSSSVVIRATRVGTETTLQQIVRLVEGAQMSKPPIQAVADRISAYFVPFVILAALATWTGWFIAGSKHVIPVEWYPAGSNAFLFALLFGISTLVIACPCALGLATPTAVMVGSGVAAAHGILIKGAAALEAAQKVRVVVFDKTGTLTQGKPAVVDHRLFSSSHRESDIMKYAAAAEASSEHPVAQAVLEYAHSQIHWPLTPDTRRASNDGASPRQAWQSDRTWIPRTEEDAEIFPGKGVQCWVRAPSSTTPLKVLLGTRKLMAEEGVKLPLQVTEYMRSHEMQGATVVSMAISGEAVAAFAIKDPTKPEAGAVVRALKKGGIQCYMVTGDAWTTARIVAEQLGIDNVMAEVLPAGKAEKVKELQATHRTAVAMVGDGINDSPALAQADVGIAIGSGTDIAIETADFVLMKSNLEDVLTAVDLSRKTFQRIWLNYVWALGYNVVMIPFAAGALYAPLRFQLPPWAAGGAMVLSSVSVVCSSLLLRLYKPPPKLQRSVPSQAQHLIV